MKTKTFVGLDVSRKFIVATAMNPQGKRVRHARFGASPRELKRFLSRLAKPTKVVLEACAFSDRLYEAAVSAGAQVVVSNPRKTRMIAESSIKTDTVDSVTLANLLRLDSVPQTYVPRPEIRKFRRLYLERRYYVQLRLSLMRHAYSRLWEHGIDYAKRVSAGVVGENPFDGTDSRVRPRN